MAELLSAFCDLGWTIVEIRAPTEAALKQKADHVFATMKAPENSSHDKDER
jgi:hypothetical protein